MRSEMASPTLLLAWGAAAAVFVPAAPSGMRYQPKGRGDSGLAIVTQEDVACGGEACFSQADCCKGAICMSRSANDAGMCVAPVGQGEGGLCVDDASCGAGLACRVMSPKLGGLGLCVGSETVFHDKHYFASCSRTLDCDTKENLCCRAQAASPGNSHPRRICSYFKFPLEDCLF